MTVGDAPREVILRPKAPPSAVLRAGMIAKQLLSADGGRVTLFEDKVKVHDTLGESEALPHRYTLAHDDRTAELFLTIGAEYDQEALNRPHTRARRDEVLAELTDPTDPRMMVTCLVSGEELSGRAADPALRRRIFETEMPFALAVIRYGDRFFFERHPEWDRARVCVEFRSPDPRFGGQQEYGRITDYRVTRIAGESRRLAFGAAALAALGIGALVLGRMRKG
jgi:staygreen protein